MQTLGRRGRYCSIPRSPIPPRATPGSCLQSRDRAAHSPLPALLPFPSLFPGASLRPGAAGPQCGRGCGASPAPGKHRGAMIEHPPGAGERDRRRPCPPAGGESGDKGSGALSQLVAVLHHSRSCKKTASGVPDVVTKGCRHPTPSQQR